MTMMLLPKADAGVIYQLPIKRLPGSRADDYAGN